MSDGPKIKAIVGDCREVIPTLGRKFDFVFADPPFNIGQRYQDFVDRKSADEHWKFMEAWVNACWDACNGVMALHGPDDLAEDYITIAIQGGFWRLRKAWINWHYRFGKCGRSNWIDARCHCLIYAKTPQHTWNPETVLVESDRVKYGDKRIHETDNGGKRLPGTVWGVPSDGPYWGRVQGNSAERRKGHPNQLPEVYLERLIRAYTNPGDWILDPFCGSGTTAVVAQALDRNCVTIDISAESIASTRERLKKGAVRVKQETVLF